MNKPREILVVVICPCCSRMKKKNGWVYMFPSDWLKLRNKYYIDESHAYCPECEKAIGRRIK